MDANLTPDLPGLLHHFADAPIEVFHQIVRLRVVRRAQPVLDTQRLAAHVEAMPPRGFLHLAREAIRKRAAVVGEPLGERN